VSRIRAISIDLICVERARAQREYAFVYALGCVHTEGYPLQRAQLKVLFMSALRGLSMNAYC
jgi:hypothetical protein